VQQPLIYRDISMRGSLEQPISWNAGIALRLQNQIMLWQITL